MTERTSTYTEASIPFPQTTGSLLVRIHHARFLMRGNVEQNEYNWAALTIEFTPARHIAEWALLTEFLASFSDRAMTLEQAAVEVYDHLLQLLRPVNLVVRLRTEGSGGFSYEVEVR